MELSMQSVDEKKITWEIIISFIKVTIISISKEKLSENILLKTFNENFLFSTEKSSFEGNLKKKKPMPKKCLS